MVRVVAGPVGMDRSISAVSLSWVELGPLFQEHQVSTALEHVRIWSIRVRGWRSDSVSSGLAQPIQSRGVDTPADRLRPMMR